MVWITTHLPLYASQYTSEGAQILAVVPRPRNRVYFIDNINIYIQVSFFLFIVTHFCL